MEQGTWGSLTRVLSYKRRTGYGFSATEQTGMGFSTELATDVLKNMKAPCNSDARSDSIAWFERRWRSSAGRASDL
jgi:hypothetical protein